MTNQEIIIKKASENEIEDFVNLGNQVWRIAYKHIFPEEVFIHNEKSAPLKIQGIKERLNNNKYLYMIAEHKGKIIGIMHGTLTSYYEYFANKEYADLVILYVHPNYQKMGIANQFKRCFESWVKENGGKKYVVGVLKENSTARRVYEHWGGKLSSHTQPLIKLEVPYDEVFYTFNL